MLLFNSINFVVAIFLLIIGFQIRVKRKLHLLSGYHPSENIDPKRLSKWIGTILLTLGCFGVLTSLISVFFTQASLPLASAFYIAIVLGVLIAAMGGNKYLNRENRKHPESK